MDNRLKEIVDNFDQMKLVWMSRLNSTVLCAVNAA